MTRLPSAARAASLVMNPMIRDRRVEQTAAVLASGVGCTVIYGFDPTGQLPSHRQLGDQVFVHRLGSRRGRKSAGAEKLAVASTIKSDRGRGRVGQLKRALVPFAVLARALVYNAQAVRALRRDRPALIWANDLPTLPAAVLAKRRSGASVIYDTHEIYTERVTDRPFDQVWRRVERAVERFFISRVDMVVTVSDGAADHLTDLHSLARKPLVVRSIPDGSAFREPEDRNLRSDIEVDDEARVVVYTGMMAPARAVDLAIRAIAAIADPDVHLAAVGYGDRSHLDSLHRLAAELGVTDRFHLVDPVASHSVVRYIAGADVAVIPGKPVSLNSIVALPNKLFEAIGAGLPLVVNDKPEITRFVRDHQVGLVVDCGDTAAFGAALESVLADPKRWTDAVSAAGATATWETEAAKLGGALRPLTAR